MNVVPDQLVLEFKGILTFNTISHLLPKLKSTLDTLGEKLNTYKRLLTITIETLENAYRYIENEELLKEYQTEFPPFIEIMKKVSTFNIRVGNTILAKDIDVISSKIDLVNGLDETGLRDLYKHIIANGKFSEVGGAGLGFIEIAKASGTKIAYQFSNIEKNIFYYTIILEVKI